MFVYQRITNGILEKPLRFCFIPVVWIPIEKKHWCWPSVDWLGKSCLIMVGFINVHKIYRWNQSLCWFNSSICVRQIPFYRHMLISIPILWWIHTWIHHIVCVGAQLQCDVMWPPMNHAACKKAWYFPYEACFSANPNFFFVFELFGWSSSFQQRCLESPY